MYGKLLGALLTVGAVSVGLGYATFAFFNDTETVGDNIFTVGTLDLHLNGGESILGFLTTANFAPGDSKSGSITLTNDGSIRNGVDGHAVHLEMDVTASATEGPVHDQSGGPSAMPLTTFLTVKTLKYDGTSILAGVVDTNGNSRIDLADLAAAPAFTTLADPGTGAGKILEINLEFDASGGNDLQGDSATFSLNFNLVQDPVANPR